MKGQNDMKTEHKLNRYNSTDNPEIDLDALFCKALLMCPVGEAVDAIRKGMIDGTTALLNDLEAGKSVKARAFLYTPDGGCVVKEITADTVGGQRAMWQWVSDNVNHYRGIIISSLGIWVDKPSDKATREALRLGNDVNTRDVKGKQVASLTIFTLGLRGVFHAELLPGRKLGKFKAADLGILDALAEKALSPEGDKAYAECMEAGEVLEKLEDEILKNVKVSEIDPAKWLCPVCGVRMDALADANAQDRPEGWTENDDSAGNAAFMCATCGTYLKRVKGVMLPMSNAEFKAMSPQAQAIMEGLHKGWEEEHGKETFAN